MGEAPPVSAPKKLRCSNAVAEKRSLVFEGWDILIIRELVVSFCAPSPELQFNQIAVADRRFNITWRGGMHMLCTRMLSSAIQIIGRRRCVSRECRIGEGILLLLNLEDVFNTGQAAANATVKANAKANARAAQVLVDANARTKAIAAASAAVDEVDEAAEADEAEHAAVVPALDWRPLEGFRRYNVGPPMTPRTSTYRLCQLAPHCDMCCPDTPSSVPTDDERSHDALFSFTNSEANP